MRTIEDACYKQNFQPPSPSKKGKFLQDYLIRYGEKGKLLMYLFPLEHG